MSSPAANHDLIADYSYLSAISKCPRYAYYAYERGLTSGDTSLALHAGRALHVAIDHLYTHNWDVEGAIEAMREAWGDFSLPATHKHAYANFGHFAVIVRNYADDRRDDPVTPIRLRVDDIDQSKVADFDFKTDSEGYIQLVESPLAVNFGDFIYGGKIDFPCITADAHAIWDHKSTRMWLSEYWVQRYAYSHQMRGYTAIIREITGLPIDRVYINGIYTGKEAADEDSAWDRRKTKRSALFGPYLYSKQMLDETLDWARRWLKLRDFFREEAAAGAGEAAWPQNDKSCFLYNEPCEYYDICKKSPHIRDAFIKVTYKKRNFTGVLASGADSDD